MGDNFVKFSAIHQVSQKLCKNFKKKQKSKWRPKLKGKIKHNFLKIKQLGDKSIYYCLCKLTNK